MAYGLEMHLIAMHRLIDKFKPTVVIVDPISNLINVGDEANVKFTLTRLIYHLKLKNITAVCTKSGRTREYRWHERPGYIFSHGYMDQSPFLRE